MDHLNEILIQEANATTSFCGSNLGNHLSFDFSTELFWIFRKIFTKLKCCFFNPELTIYQTKLDGSDIRFPEVSSCNTSDNANEMTTFLALPKQNTNASKGKYFIWSDHRCWRTEHPPTPTPDFDPRGSWRFFKYKFL